MKEHPILFSTEMIKAILRSENPKTHTRRLIDYKGIADNLFLTSKNTFVGMYTGGRIITQEQIDDCARRSKNIKRKYNIGDILWVREAFCYTANIAFSENEITKYDKANAFGYKADLTAKYYDDGEETLEPLDTIGWNWGHETIQWKPSIHMPRRASRIQLEIVDIKLQRIQEITSREAIKEGYPIKSIEEMIKPDFLEHIKNLPEEKRKLALMTLPEDALIKTDSPKEWFEKLWNSLNEKLGYGWNTNPWVWDIEFRRLK